MGTVKGRCRNPYDCDLYGKYQKVSEDNPVCSECGEPVD